MKFNPCGYLVIIRKGNTFPNGSIIGVFIMYNHTRNFIESTTRITNYHYRTMPSHHFRVENSEFTENGYEYYVFCFLHPEIELHNWIVDRKTPFANCREHKGIHRIVVLHSNSVELNSENYRKIVQALNIRTQNFQEITEHGVWVLQCRV